jgi:hypothetical protein
LTIEGKWLEAIVHMKKSEFLDLPCPKQVQLFISIRIHGKFQLSTTPTLVGFQENIQQFIPQMETNLKGEGLITPLVIIPTNNVQHNVKRKFDFNFFNEICFFNESNFSMRAIFSMEEVFQWEQFFQ